MEEIKKVGGIIFFIDETSDEVVTFLDKDGNEIENVAVGDMPYSYKVVKPGEKPRFWVFNHMAGRPGTWWPYGIDRKKIGTSMEFGSGSRNTEAVLDYLKAYDMGDDSIWARLVKMRDRASCGCDDWFIPSRGEMDVLREFFAAATSDPRLINPFDIAWFWSSSEHSAQYAWSWRYDYQDWLNYSKNYDVSFLAVRAF